MTPFGVFCVIFFVSGGETKQRGEEDDRTGHDYTAAPAMKRQGAFLPSELGAPPAPNILVCKKSAS